MEMRQLVAGLLFGLMFHMHAATAAVAFFNNRAAFEAGLTSETTITFEGVVAPNSFVVGSSFTLNGVTFTTIPPGVNEIGISGPTGPVAGSPYQSAVLF